MEEDNDDSPASAFSSIFKKLKSKIAANFSKQLKKKTKEIVKAVTETMIANIKIAEINILNNISSLTNTSLAEKQMRLEEELGKLKGEITKNNDVVLNEIAFDKANFKV